MRSDEPLLPADETPIPIAKATTVAQMQAWVDSFARDRSWERYHTPKNLALSVAIEAAELLEHFQWSEGPDRERLANREIPSHGNKSDTNNPNESEVAEELSDVLAYLLRLASVLDIDLATALQSKMRKNAIKYPVDMEHRFD